MHIYLLIGTTNEIPTSTFPDSTRQTFPLESIKEARELVSYVKNGFSIKTAIVLNNFDQVSIEAQNALLKTFEEPKQNLSFILTAKSTSGIAETILSRVNVENVESGEVEYREEVKTFLEEPKNRLSIISVFKEREEALKFLHNLMKEALDISPEKLQIITNCFNAIKGNGNVQLHLTNLVAKFS